MKTIRIQYTLVRLILNKIGTTASNWDTSISKAKKVSRSAQIKLLDYIDFLKDICRVIKKYKQLFKRDIADVKESVKQIEMADLWAGRVINDMKDVIKKITQ